MPNWCLVNYKIVGPKEQIGRFADMLKELESLPKPRVENGFGKLWLGCLIDYLGEDWKKIWCRGMINDWDIDSSGGMITLCVMSAWGEAYATRKFLKEKFHGCDFWFLAEEPGNCYYVKNDADGEYFPEKFVLEYSDGDGFFEREYFEDIKDVPPFLKENFDIACEPDLDKVREALDAWEEKDGNDHAFAYINEFTIGGD